MKIEAVQTYDEISFMDDLMDMNVKYAMLDEIPTPDSTEQAK
jgi:hypothetical protein